MSLALLATSLVDGGKLLDLLSGRLKAGRGRPPRDRRGPPAMLFAAMLAIPVILAIWFAPALVVFRTAAPPRRWRPACARPSPTGGPSPVYGLRVLPVRRRPARDRDGDGRRRRPAGTRWSSPSPSCSRTLFLFVATLHVSDYVSYRDVFHSGEARGRLPRAAARPS
ncbi:MAG: hypothetical protein IPO75_03615 [Betaproteobacteria bacterium]|nr:hypothetical protein [Betaproteobacteria bacterium]